MPCRLSPAARQHQQHERVDHVGHGRLGLPDADRLDEHHVVAGRLEHDDGLARGAGDAAEAPAARRRADERVLVDRPAASSGSCRRGCCRRCGSTTGRRRARRRGGRSSMRSHAERFDERRLAGAGHAGDADAVGAAGRRQEAPQQLLRRAAGGRRGVDSTSVIARPIAARSPARTRLDVAVDVHRAGGSSSAVPPSTPSSSSTAASAMTVPGGKIAAAPAARRASKSCGGMTPPTTTAMSSRPSASSARRSCGHERQVAGGERRHADDVHVGLDRLAGDLLGGLEQRADVDVEAEVGEGAWRSPSGRGRGRPGPSWRRGSGAGGPARRANSLDEVAHLGDVRAPRRPRCGTHR